MNILRDIARRRVHLSKTRNRLAKYADSVGTRAVLAGGELQTADTSAMSATFVISTNDVDRDGDVLIPGGCDLSAYSKNPIVLWDHQSDKYPLGKAEKDGRLHVTIAADRVLSTCFFHGKTRESNETFELVSEGVVRGASVGFLPKKHRKSGEKGYVFDEWELTEWSITPLGANAGALRLHLDKGKVKSMSLRKRLEPFAARPSRSWSNGVSLEKKAMDDYDDDDKDKKDDPVDDIEKDEMPEEEAAESPEHEAEETPEEETAEHEDEGGETAVKPGARTLGMLAAAFDMLAQQIEASLGDNEHPEVVAKLQSLLERCQADAQEAKDDLASLYPDVDAESVMPSGEMPAEEPAPEPMPEDEPLEEMQAKNAKRLSKAASMCVKDASEFLGDLAGEATIPSRFKSGCRYHAKSLEDMLAGPEKEDDKGDEPEVGEQEEKALLALARKTAKWRIAK